MEALTAWAAQLNLDGLWELLVTVMSSLLCITVHETCHGLAALAMGDPTAKRMGRLSLNPLKHVDFFGLVMMAVAGFGWAKAVPINMRNFKNPKRGMALSALAGPVSNILLAMLAMLGYSVCAFYYHYYGSDLWYWAWYFCLNTMLLSTGLAIFNLFPIPPLDGSKVLFSVLPEKWYDMLMRYERYGMIVLMVLLVTGILNGPLGWLRTQAITLMEAVCLWPYDVLTAIYS